MGATALCRRRGSCGTTDRERVAGTSFTLLRLWLSRVLPPEVNDRVCFAGPRNTQKHLA